jgi:lysozyme
MDTEEGDDDRPTSLHKYLYGEADPIDNLDPSGNEIDVVGALSVNNTLDEIYFLNPPITISVAIHQATTLSERGLRFIAIQEGFKNHLYNDSADHCTIGYGHLVSLNKCSQSSEASQFSMGITKQGAESLLWQDAQEKIGDVRELTSVGLKQNEFDAITSFVFNVGRENYKISDLRKTLNEGHYFFVPPLFFHFTRAGTDPNALRSRRQDESRLFEFGIYIARGRIVPTSWKIGGP